MSAKPTSIDTNILSDLFYYCLTLTSADNFSDDQEAGIVDWHRKRAEFCLLVREYHKDGRRHYHSLLAVKSPKSAGAVTKNLTRLWGSLKLNYTPNSVKVKRMSNMAGQFHYCLKELKGDNPLLLIGWQYTWIKDLCKKNLKNIPHKLLKGETYMVQKNTFVELVLKFASASGIRITCKETFIDVCIDMQEQGYQFDNIKKKDLLTNVMARCGCRQASRNVWESELFHF